MSFFIKEFAKRKFNQLTQEDLLSYSRQYGFSLSSEEAKHIVAYIHNHSLDPFSQSDRTKMLEKLAEITGPQTAYKAEKLFDEIIQSYGLQYLFDK